MISGGKIRTRSLRNLILLVMAIHDGDGAARKPVIRSFPPKLGISPSLSTSPIKEDEKIKLLSRLCYSRYCKIRLFQ